MRCALCGNSIEKYHPKLNHIVLEDGKGADICLDCVDKFLRWQKKVFAELFPMKKFKNK